MAAGVELAAFAYSIYSCSLAISSLCCLASLFFCCRSSISLRLSRFSSSGLADWLRSRMVVSAWVNCARRRLFSSWRAWSAIMGVWWAGLCALGVWSTNSPSGDSNSCCWSSGSVSEPVRGVLEVEEVPKAGCLPLRRFAVSGGVLCIMVTDRG